MIHSDDDGFEWLKWLNPQDGKRYYVGARSGAKAAVTNYNKHKNEKAAKKIALASFGKRGRGDFNLWSDDEEQASDSSACDGSDASNASNASGSSRTTTSSSHTPTPSNASIVPPHGSYVSLLFTLFQVLFTIFLSLFHFFHPLFLVDAFFSTNCVT